MGQQEHQARHEVPGTLLHTDRKHSLCLLNLSSCACRWLVFRKNVSLCVCIVSRRVHGECTAFRLMSALTECLLHLVLHTRSWLRCRPTSGIAWSTQCCWASAPHSLWVHTSAFLTAFLLMHWWLFWISPTSEDILMKWRDCRCSVGEWVMACLSVVELWLAYTVSELHLFLIFDDLMIPF